MAAQTYTSVVLAERPKGILIPGQMFTIKQNPILKDSDLKDGEVLIESLYLSLDPAMTGWMSDIRSYQPPVQIGEIMRGITLNRILASRSASHPVGALVTAMAGWTEFAIMPAKSVEIVHLPSNCRLTDALGVLGYTGLAAYFGIIKVGEVKKGDFVVVSGAAGATGSVACQIAKLKGATVLGLAGSEDKVQWVKELGCDNALNYKDPDFHKKFKEATPNFIDVFFDNVGGEVLEAALSQAKKFARFVMCGWISQYNTVNPHFPRNLPKITTMRIRMQGFIVFDFASEYASARKELAQWLAEGKIQRKETIMKGGLRAAEKALLGLYEGVNTGKLLVEIKEENIGKASL